jgi:predicted metalloprotease with PDZ domain
MIHYLFYQKNPASHYVYIDLTVSALNQDAVELVLPSWRPGRYEFGNFSKNIKRVDVFDDTNQPINYIKTDKETWLIQTKGLKYLKITYSYYSNELNAGACFADVNQIYINPVHCCMRVKGFEKMQHQIELNIPDHYKIVTSLPVNAKTLSATNYDELVDSPFVASPYVQSGSYTSRNCVFHLHFIGTCKPNWELYKKDFIAFTDKMIDFWGDCPVNEYHFIFQILNYKFYHGVEHQKNTVIAIGPGYAINQGETYEDVLGVSCHELFHTWNIKYIRPVEMLPYQYNTENYARTGYVYEGFTTYYGDKLLLSSGVFNNQDYFKTLEERMQKHFHNFGRYNLSVAASSWETWLDGYVPGAPYRKTNIYDEGNLIALMLDVKLMKATNNSKSLRDLCVLLYERFGKQNKGYAEQDIILLANELSGEDLSSFFSFYVYGTNDFETGLQEAFSYLNIQLDKKANTNCSEHLFGFKTIDSGTNAKVSVVAPYSPSWKSGLFQGDEIIAVNSIILRSNLNHWLNYFSDEDEIILTLNSADAIKTIKITRDKKGTTYFPNYKLSINEESANYKLWKSNLMS